MEVDTEDNESYGMACLEKVTPVVLEAAKFVQNKLDDPPYIPVSAFFISENYKLYSFFGCCHVPILDICSVFTYHLLI